MRILKKQAATNYVAHATTAHKRFHRPQSSLRFGRLLHRGRGRFFFWKPTRVVYANRPIVAVIETDATDRRMLCALLSALDVDVRDYDSAESFLAAPDHDPGCLITDLFVGLCWHRGK